MADFINAAYAYLQAWSSTFRQDYAPGVTNMIKRHGRTTRILPSRKRRMQGNSIEYELKTSLNRSTRLTKNLMDPMPDPGPGVYMNFKVNFDHTDETNNDIVGFGIGFRTTIFDIKKRADRTWKDSPDFIEKDIQEGLADVKETFAKYIHLPVDGLLANIAANGIRNDDDDLWDDATAYTAGQSDALIQLNATAIARIGDGQIIELRNSGTLLINNVRVVYTHPHQETIAVELTSDSVDSGGATVTNFDSVNTAVVTNGDTVGIFLNGNYNVTMSGSLAQLMDPSQAYYGKVREDDGTANYEPKNRMLIPIRIPAGGAALTEDFFSFVGESEGFRMGGFDSKVDRAMIMSKYEFRQVRKIAKDAGITLTPALESDIGKKLNKHIGFDGTILHDPNLGTVMVVVDDFAEPGNIDFINRSDWEIVSPIDGGFFMFPGTLGGIWSREGEPDGTGRLGKTFSAEGLQLSAFVCTAPKSQTRILGLATT